MVYLGFLGVLCLIKLYKLIYNTDVGDFYFLNLVVDKKTFIKFYALKKTRIITEIFLQSTTT